MKHLRSMGAGEASTDEKTSKTSAKQCKTAFWRQKELLQLKIQIFEFKIWISSFFLHYQPQTLHIWSICGVWAPGRPPKTRKRRKTVQNSAKQCKTVQNSILAVTPSRYFWNFEFKNACFVLNTLPTHPQTHFQQLSSLTQRQQRPANNQKTKKSKKQLPQRNSQRKTSKLPERPLVRSKKTYTQVSKACYTRQALFPHLL